jgi:hypothetical protein
MIRVSKLDGARVPSLDGESGVSLFVEWQPRSLVPGDPVPTGWKTDAEPSAVIALDSPTNVATIGGRARHDQRGTWDGVEVAAYLPALSDEGDTATLGNHPRHQAGCFSGGDFPSCPVPTAQAAPRQQPSQDDS